MSNRTKNEICLELWRFYKAERADGLDVEPLKKTFRHELFLGYRTEGKNAIEGAAEQRITIQTMESLVLAKNKAITMKYRLNFRDERNPQQMLRTMVGSMILETGISEDQKTIWAKKTDGENEFTIVADNPVADYKVDMVIWIAEPFVMSPDEKAGKLWSEMTKEEREEATNKAAVKSGSAMPKYMQKRRAKIKSITVNGDDVNAWLQLQIEEVEPFERQAFEDEEVLKELGISRDEAETEDEESKKDGQIIEKAVQDNERGIDVSKIEEGHFLALEESERDQGAETATEETESTGGEEIF